MLNNFKIGARLGIGFAATLIFLMTIAAIGVFRLQAVNSELNTLLKDRFPKTVMVNSINDNINVVARALRNMLLERTEDAQQKELARIVEARKVVSEGHTDERGGREYNLALGQKRAEAVRRSLGLLGVPDGQMEAVSFGKEKLAAQGSGEEVHAQNRRAELSYR